MVTSYLSLGNVFQGVIEFVFELILRNVLYAIRLIEINTATERILALSIAALLLLGIGFFVYRKAKRKHP